MDGDTNRTLPAGVRAGSYEHHAPDSGYSGWVEPDVARPGWILFVGGPDGAALLHERRDEDGGVLGLPRVLRPDAEPAADARCRCPGWPLGHDHDGRGALLAHFRHEHLPGPQRDRLGHGQRRNFRGGGYSQNHRASGIQPQIFKQIDYFVIDEIHRFNKAQQDALLHVVEDGNIVLIGATTENPSFEVISPLLSRCQVYQMQPLDNTEIRAIVEQAIKNDSLLSEKQVNIEDWESLYILADGDARRALNVIEKAVDLLEDQPPPQELSKEIFEKAALQKVFYYDKAGATQ